MGTNSSSSARSVRTRTAGPPQPAGRGPRPPPLLQRRAEPAGRAGATGRPRRGPAQPRAYASPEGEARERPRGSSTPPGPQPRPARRRVLPRSAKRPTPARAADYRRRRPDLLGRTATPQCAAAPPRPAEAESLPGAGPRHHHSNAAPGPAGGRAYPCAGRPRPRSAAGGAAGAAGEAAGSGGAEPTGCRAFVEAANGRCGGGLKSAGGWGAGQCGSPLCGGGSADRSAPSPARSFVGAAVRYLGAAGSS